MCCAAFIVKYVLFFANVVFSLAGLALVGLGIAVLVNFSEVLEIVPAALNAIPISVIVIGAVVFSIAALGCCGAVRESRCLLIMYSVCMLVLAAVKIYLAVVIFRSLGNIYDTVEGWIRDAFNNTNLREPFHVVEVAFRCCGVNGPGSYEGVYPALPPSCCPQPSDDGALTCASADAYGGCANIVADYFEVFGDAIGAVLVTVIIVEMVWAIAATPVAKFCRFLVHCIVYFVEEVFTRHPAHLRQLVAMIFGMFLSNSVTNRKRGFA